MKKLQILLMFFISVTLGCERDRELTFASEQIITPPCEKCVNIDLIFPIAEGQSECSERINDTLRSFVLKFLDGQGRRAQNIEESIRSVEASYQELIGEFPEIKMDWELSVHGKVNYQSADVISVIMETYSFMGGAHGNAGTYFLNFDARTGEKLIQEQLFSDIEGFTRLIEAKFREHYKIGADASINSTGFWFEDDRFSLPENIGYDKDSLELVYQTYEIASYSDGPQFLIVSYDEVDSFLNYH